MYATLEQAGQWIADARGLCWPEDRDEIVVLINRIRAEFYLLPDVHWTIPLCLPVGCFCEPCPDCEPCTCGSSTSYAGFTLPPGFVNVISTWQGRRPVTIIDRWAIYPWDSEWEHCDCFNVRDMGEGFVFQADPDCDDCLCLQFHARDRNDAGKVVTVRYIEPDGRLRTEEIELSDEWPSTQREIRQVQPRGISLPSNLVGEVVVKDQDNRRLATYQPWETVPNYRRFKLVGCAVNFCQQIAVIAQRDGTPLYDNADVLETGNQMIWENAARWLYLHEKTNADGVDQANEVKFYAKFTAGLQEEARRRRGMGKRFAVRFRGLTEHESRLGFKRGRIGEGRTRILR